MFQRARSAEQREVRRRAILDTAADMLAEMPVAEVTLNELSRRVGLAKSNVLRYFESREAVLLELLATAWGEWLADLPGDLDRAVDPAAPVTRRGDQVAAAVAASLAARPVLCDLLSAQAAVLERNVSPDLAATYNGAFITAVINFAILAFIIFLMVKFINNLRKPSEAEAAAPAAPAEDTLLLREIRDSLKNSPR